MRFTGEALLILYWALRPEATSSGAFPRRTAGFVRTCSLGTAQPLLSEELLVHGSHPEQAVRMGGLTEKMKKWQILLHLRRILC